SEPPFLTYSTVFRSAGGQGEKIVSALRRGELVYGALHLIALAITLHRRDRVVVGRPRLETSHVHAERRPRMGLVQRDGGFRRLRSEEHTSEPQLRDH